MDEITNLMLQQIREVEEKDESQILAELAGETIGEYIYETEVKDPKAKKKVRKVKLSWAGVKEVARSRGNIVLSEPIITDTDDALRVVIKATDLTRNFTVFGGCHQPRLQKVNIFDRDTGEITGEKYDPDPYYFQKALSKAQRNALNLCIPGDYAARCIDRFMRMAGKTPLLSHEVKKITDGNGDGKKPVKSEIKPLEEWDAVTQEEVPDLPTLERVIWNLSKIQPREMYKQLGYTSRLDVNESTWECFLKLREMFSPVA